MKISNSIVLLISIFSAQNLFAQAMTYGGSAAGLGLYGAAQACPYGNPMAGMSKEDMQIQVLKNKIDKIKQEQDDMAGGYEGRFSDDNLPLRGPVRNAFVDILKSDRKEGKGGGAISCHRDPPATREEQNPTEMVRSTGGGEVVIDDGKTREEKKIKSKKADNDDGVVPDGESSDDNSTPGSNKTDDIRNMEKYFSHDYCGDLDNNTKSDFYNISSLHDICHGSQSIFVKQDKTERVDHSIAIHRCDDFISDFDRLERDLRETERKLKPLKERAEQKQYEQEKRDDEDDMAGRPHRSMYTEAGVCPTCGYAPEAQGPSMKPLIVTGILDALSIGAWYKNAGREIRAGQELGYAPGFMGAPNATATSAYLYSLGRTGGLQGGSGSFGCSPQMGYAQGQNGLYGSAYGNVSPYGLCGGAINSPCAGGQPGFGYPNGFNPYAGGGIYPMGVGPGGVSGPWGGNAGFYPNPFGVSQFPGGYGGAGGGPFANPMMGGMGMGGFPAAGGFPGMGFPGGGGLFGGAGYPGMGGQGYPGTFGGPNPFGSAFGAMGGGPFANPMGMGGQFGGPSMFGGSPIGGIFGGGLANPYAGGQFNQMGASPIALQQFIQQGWFSLQQEGILMQQKAQYLYSLQNSLGYGGGSFASPYSTGYGQTFYGFGNYGGYNPYISQPGLSIGITAPLGGPSVHSYGR